MNEIDKLIDDLGLTEKELVYIDAYSKGYNDGYSGARKIFRNKQQWVRCSERLPEKHKTVLITHRGGVSFGWHNGKHWERGASQNHRPLQTVIAWMPLPEPYRGENDG